MPTVENFINEFNEKKIRNTQANPNAVSEYIRRSLDIKKYILFREKRTIAEMIVEQNITEVDGIKRYNTINAYVSFVIAMLSAHTNLEFSEDPVADYDLLAESGLLPQIVAEFQNDYNECEIILKMELAMKLEDNNVNVLIGHFLDSILKKLEGASEVLNEKFKDVNFNDILGVDINKENLAKLSGFLDKLK